MSHSPPESWKEVTLNCFVCDGSGKVRDHKDRDEHEGYKLAPLYNCSFCSGRGNIPSTRHDYAACLAYTHAMIELKARASRKNSIIQKLSEEERAMIIFKDELVK